MSYHSRGAPPDRGRGRGRGNILIQHGKRTLVSKDLSKSQGIDPVTFQEYLALKQQKDGNASSSYANVVKESEESSSSDYILNEEEKLIMILEEDDKRWQEQPYLLMERYSLNLTNYKTGSYKSPIYFDNILQNCGSCEISHFSGTNKEIYNFSKIIIKKIISQEEWGLSPFKERSYLCPRNKVPIKYNYWDYLDAFDKVLLYENDKMKHTWMIKVCSKVYNYKIPNWFINWWNFNGTKEDILPEKLKAYFLKWKHLSPINNKFSEQEKGIKSFMYFMIEFSIPYIWKWVPSVKTLSSGLPCLKRHSETKFWEKMIRPDVNTGIIPGEETLKDIEEKLKSFAQFQKEQITGRNLTKSPLSKKQIVEEYLNNLVVMLEEEDKASSESSMAISAKELFGNAFQTLELMEDSQDPNEDQEPTLRELIENVKSDIVQI